MVSFKKCKKCEEDKPVGLFYKHSKMADGLLSFCKECVKARVRKHRIENIDAIREYDRKRSKEPGRAAAASAVSNRWRKRDARIMAAHNKVARAIRSGDLKKEPCIICGREKAFAHHESYNRPLDVVWYCQPCHKERHKQMAILGIDPLAEIDDEP